MKRTSLSMALLAGFLVAVTGLAWWSGRQADSGSRLPNLSSAEHVQTRVPIREAERGDAESDATANSTNSDQGGSRANTFSGSSTRVRLAELLKLAGEIKHNLRQNVRDYRAILLRRERISGNLGAEFKTQIKIRHPDFKLLENATGENATGLPGISAYLKFIEPRSTAGREVIWVQNQNDNKLVVHESGFLNLTRFNLVPTGRLAMMGNKYPITEIGLLRLVEKLLEKCETIDIDQCRLDVRDNETIGERQCQLIQITQPKTAPGADFHVAQVFVDTERLVPLRYAAFLWPKNAGDAPPLEEEYTYLDLELNVGLSESDFDPDNPEYDFP